MVKAGTCPGIFVTVVVVVVVVLWFTWHFDWQKLFNPAATCRLVCAFFQNVLVCVIDKAI